jgi:hypothetical protein
VSKSVGIVTRAHVPVQVAHRRVVGRRAARRAARRRAASAARRRALGCTKVGALHVPNAYSAIPYCLFIALRYLWCEGPPPGYGGPPPGYGGPPMGMGGPPMGFGGPPMGMMVRRNATQQFTLVLKQFTLSLARWLACRCTRC